MKGRAELGVVKEGRGSEGTVWRNTGTKRAAKHAGPGRGPWKQAVCIYVKVCILTGNVALGKWLDLPRKTPPARQVKEHLRFG